MDEIDKLPDDADGDAIRRVIRHGADTARPMAIDFMVTFADQSAGQSFEKTLNEQDFQTSLESDSEQGTWTCYCTRTMLLEYAAILDTQKMLSKAARDFGGEVDGWATFGNGAS